jgi:hypothetical protein
MQRMGQGAHEPFFTRARVARLAVVAILLYAAMGAAFILTAKNGFDALGIPLGFDFLAFHGGARMATEGRLAEAFDPYVFQTTLEQQAPSVGFGYHWLYPPAFGLMVQPFGYLPYGAAFWTWTILGLAAYGAAAWLLTRDRLAVLAAFAFSAVWVAAYHGQNSFFVAALAIAACYGLLARKDGFAGVAIGLLAFKPHLAVLFPLALICAGRWRAFAIAALTATAFTAAGVVILGTDYLGAYLGEGLPGAAALIETSKHWPTLTSVYVSARLVGATPAIAAVLHGVVACAAALLVAIRFRKEGATCETLALLCAAGLLISPYVMDYDLMMLAPAGLLLCSRRKTTATEQWAIFGAALIPILVVGLGREGIQVGWAAPVLAMAVACGAFRVTAPRAQTAVV